jgi:hypothetical protein
MSDGSRSEAPPEVPLLAPLKRHFETFSVQAAVAGV